MMKNNFIYIIAISLLISLSHAFFNMPAPVPNISVVQNNPTFPPVIQTRPPSMPTVSRLPIPSIPQNTPTVPKPPIADNIPLVPLTIPGVSDVLSIMKRAGMFSKSQREMAFLSAAKADKRLSPQEAIASLPELNKQLGTRLNQTQLLYFCIAADTNEDGFLILNEFSSFLRLFNL